VWRTWASECTGGVAASAIVSVSTEFLVGTGACIATSRLLASECDNQTFYPRKCLEGVLKGFDLF
jgi:hypothetical protein